MSDQQNQSSRTDSRHERQPVPLDYCPPPSKPNGFWPQFDRWRARIPSDPELRRWWWRRGMYYGVLALIFATVAFYFGPNLILFGKLTRPSPADFIAVTRRPGNIASVKAIMQFEADHGRWPSDERDLVPRYLPDINMLEGRVLPGEYVSFVRPFGHEITYRFTLGSEGWWVRGPTANGRIPVPPVMIGPHRQPVTRPQP